MELVAILQGTLVPALGNRAIGEFPKLCTNNESHLGRACHSRETTAISESKRMKCKTKDAGVQPSHLVVESEAGRWKVSHGVLIATWTLERYK